MPISKENSKRDVFNQMANSKSKTHQTNRKKKSHGTDIFCWKTLTGGWNLILIITS